jgi:hypothetical protein
MTHVVLVGRCSTNLSLELTDYTTLRQWECLDSDIRLYLDTARLTGGDLAEEVRKYHIPDFSNWKNHDAFEPAFARLGKGFAGVGSLAPSGAASL